MNFDCSLKLFFAKKNINQAKKKVNKYYEIFVPTISMVKKWFTEFRCGCISTNDAERSGRPIEVSTPENVEKYVRDSVVSILNGFKKVVCMKGATFAIN